MALTEDTAFRLMEGAYTRDRLAHAFLVSGPVGSGKRDLASRVIAMVNPAERDGSADLFGESVEASRPAHLDELEGEFVSVVRPRSKSRRILMDDVRSLERKMHLGAPSGTWKVGVVVDADRMFDEPANAFLKTLEEPPPGCLLLLLTTNVEILLPTVRSRCVEIVLQARAGSDFLEEGERAAFGAILARSAARPTAHGALLLKAAFESLLGMRKEEIEATNKNALKQESDAYKKAIEGDWLDEREKYYQAMAASEYLAVRSALVDWLISWLGDAVRQKAGSAVLSFAQYAEDTRKLADSQEMTELLWRIETLEELRSLLNTNVPENLALEVCFLKAFGAPALA